jgi:hypothetical protein
VFLPIYNHVSQWAGFESRIKQTGTDLNIFGQKFVIIGSDLVEAVNAMPILQRIKKVSGTSFEVSYKLDDEDNAIKMALPELLDELKKETDKRLGTTKNLADDLTQYSADMDNNIVPAVSTMDTNLQNLNLNAEKTKLLQEKQELQKEIETQDKLYTKYCGLAFTGAAGAVLGPLVIVSWAITGGIYGAKAEKARKERNKAKADLQNVINKLASEETFVKKVGALKANTSNMKLIVDEAAMGLRNLEALWQAVGKYIEEAKNELDSIDNGKSLILFKAKMENATKSWGTVRDMTKELIDLFEAAQKEADREGAK